MTQPLPLPDPDDRPTVDPADYPAVPPYRAGLSADTAEALDDPDRIPVTYEGVWGLLVVVALALTALVLLVLWVHG